MSTKDVSDNETQQCSHLVFSTLLPINLLTQPVVVVNCATAYGERVESRQRMTTAAYRSGEPRSVNAAVRVTVRVEYANKRTGWKSIGRAIS